MVREAKADAVPICEIAASGTRSTSRSCSTRFRRAFRADMPATNLPDEQIWQLAAFVRALSAPAIESKPPGDAAAGEAMFWGKANCGNCHRVLGRGGMLGPDLSNIGAQRPVDQLREAILDPDADGFRGYQGVTAITKDGRTVTGVARSRTNYSVVILDNSGNCTCCPTSELRERQVLRSTRRCHRITERLSREEFDNVIAFLSRLSVRPYTAAAEKETMTFRSLQWPLF